MPLPYCHFEVGCTAIGVLALTCAVVEHCRGREARRRALEESGLPQLLRALSGKGALLRRVGGGDVVRGDMDTVRPMTTLAAVLEAFEARVRIERLSGAFLKRRAEWLSELHVGRASPQRVAAAAAELLAAVKTPPRRDLVIAALRSRPDARRLGKPIWRMIFDFVGGAEPIATLLQAPLRHYTRGPPCDQVLHAVDNFRLCVVALRRLTTSRTRDNDPDAAAVAGAAGAGYSAEALEKEITTWWEKAPVIYGLISARLELYDIDAPDGASTITIPQ
eukprot:NODE_1225_length_2554_cov_4.214668.p3 GENE.NODE_1225_length_2554_cov_4.214668~~NODE_1225_length_2554_cov_4.214668.p3  ORF type:complete len:277 (-),score=89.74 NODE_1225_length_2554_cov_4.214668:351-1181(-)